MSEQLGMFDDKTVVRAPVKTTSKAEKEKSVQNKQRYGVCECGAKGWPLKVEAGTLYRLCKCGRKEAV